MLETVLREAMAGVTPGAVLACGDAGHHVATVCAGNTAGPEMPGLAQPITPTTFFDVASLTKAVVTSAVLMQLVARGRLALDTPVQTHLPELRSPGAERIQVQHLAGHAAGLPAHVEFFRRLWAGERLGARDAREALLRMAAACELVRPAGTQTEYSDVGYILLGHLLERAGGARLDALARQLVFEPLGMQRVGFVDLLAVPPAPRPAPVAATERCPVRGVVVGEVHDENCHAGGGISGHAGLFATADELAVFARAVNAAATGTAIGGFEPAVVQAFLTRSAAPGTTWRLGWDSPSPLPARSQAGDLWPRSGVGHLGFTGCALWLDPPRGRYAVLLTNRVHLSRDPAGILALRRRVMDAVVRTLDGTPS